MFLYLKGGGKPPEKTFDEAWGKHVNKHQVKRHVSTSSVNGGTRVSHNPYPMISCYFIPISMRFGATTALSQSDLDNSVVFVSLSGELLLFLLCTVLPLIYGVT